MSHHTANAELCPKSTCSLQTLTHSYDCGAHKQSEYTVGQQTMKVFNQNTSSPYWSYNISYTKLGRVGWNIKII